LMIRGDNVDSNTNNPAVWPADGLETIAACPVCGSPDSTVAQAALTDRIFYCAPGQWVLRRCGGCQSGYLNPRPTPASIGLAYAEYYTHGLAETDNLMSSSTLLGSRLPAIRNAYLNQRFPRAGYSPAWPWAVRALACHRPTQDLAERDVRHLPTPAAGARLLDIGCGSGEFVRRALRLGYAAEGLEFDEQAVKAGAEHGLPIRQGALPDTGLPGGIYDAVCLSQVIEHLHAPRAALTEIYRLLKPGGFFWLATPNMDAPGHRQFGPDWRGLEPPRHLVLFSAKALKLALQQAGFVDVAFKPIGAVSEWFFNASYRIANGAKPGDAIALPAELKKQALAEDQLAMADPCAGEELIVVGWKAELG
jgi:2-polyprenyl-3-methyl-5-hydroxy-6-metoxy-1,4-benzoquinol methylase